MFDDRALGPEQLAVEDVRRVGVEDRRELADGAVREPQRRDDARVVLEVLVHALRGRERRHLDDLAAEVAEDVDRVAAAADDGAPGPVLRHERRVAGVGRLERVPVVGLAVDEVAEDAVGDQLLDGQELRVPAQHEARHGLHAGLGDRVADRERVVERRARPASRSRCGDPVSAARTQCSRRESGCVHEAMMSIRSSSKSSSTDAYSRASTPCVGEQRGRLAGRPVVDADELRQRVVAEHLDVLAGDPARADDSNAVLGHVFLLVLLRAGVGDDVDLDHDPRKNALDGRPGRLRVGEVLARRPC